jgi:hypothetical protein
MRLRYENNLEDMVELSLYLFDRSPTARRTATISWWVFCSALLVLFFVSLNWLLGENSTTFVAIFTAGLAAWWVCTYRGDIRRAQRKQLRKYYSEQQHKSFCCEHTVEIIEAGFIERTAFNENKYTWNGLGEIARTPNHTFIFTSADAAQVIPHDRIVEGDCEAFIAQLQKRIDQHKSNAGE